MNGNCNSISNDGLFLSSFQCSLSFAVKDIIIAFLWHCPHDNTDSANAKWGFLCCQHNLISIFLVAGIILSEFKSVHGWRPSLSDDAAKVGVKAAHRTCYTCYTWQLGNLGLGGTSQFRWPAAASERRGIMSLMQPRPRCKFSVEKTCH